MPRTRKPAKHEGPVAIPTNSLVASAVRYSGKAARIYQPNKEWQRECYRHYAICGEARFAAKFFGHAMSRATLGVSKKSTKGLVPEEKGRGASTLAELFNGKDGQAQMLSALGTHLTIAGECYLVGRTVKAEDSEGDSAPTDEVWEVLSILEVAVTGKKWTINYGDGYQPIPLTDDDVVIRIWIPNPAKRVEADSPFRSLLPVLTEIEWLTKHIFAQAQSRLAGAGVLMLPQEMTFPEPPKNNTDEGPQPQNSADSFMLTLADAMVTPIEDPEAPSAKVPIVVQAPGEYIDKAKLLTFWSEMDAGARDMRRDAIRRFALGMDLPPEQIEGMSSNPGTGGGNSNGVSHWGAWQIEESTIKLHIEPMLELVVNALTIGYLRPLPETVDYVVTYNSANLRMRPDRSKESIELYNLGALSIDTVLRENGFDTSDKMDHEEYKDWLLRKVATGSATPEQVQAALQVIGVDLGPLAQPDQTPRETRPDPSIADHPVRPRDPSEHPEAAALLAASDALVFRALERGGNRIRQATGIKPPNTPAYEMHLLHQVNGDSGKYLTDAWSCAPQVLDGLTRWSVDEVVSTLDAYCRNLMHQQTAHSRERLREWLQSTLILEPEPAPA